MNVRLHLLLPVPPQLEELTNTVVVVVVVDDVDVRYCEEEDSVTTVFSLPFFGAENICDCV